MSPVHDVPTVRRTKLDVRREATYAKLLDAGDRLFPVKGFTQASITEIAAAAGVTHGAFYFHFASKEHYFVAVIARHNVQRGEWWLAGADPGNPTLLAAVTDGLSRMHSDYAGSDPNWIRPVLEFQLAVRDNPEFAPTLQRINEEWVSELERFVTIVAERGWARTDVSTREIAEYVQATSQGLRMQRYFYGFEPSAFISQIVRTIQP